MDSHKVWGIIIVGIVVIFLGSIFVYMSTREGPVFGKAIFNRDTTKMVITPTELSNPTTKVYFMISRAVYDEIMVKAPFCEEYYGDCNHEETQVFFYTHNLNYDSNDPSTKIYGLDGDDGRYIKEYISNFPDLTQKTINGFTGYVVYEKELTFLQNINKLNFRLELVRKIRDPELRTTYSDIFVSEDYEIELVAEVRPVPDELCFNNNDDDNDGFKDCKDFDCQSVGTGVNRCCAVDSDCQDNLKCDSVTSKCEDADCFVHADCGTGATCNDHQCYELYCTDVVDNDGDGKSDCNDPDCEIFPFCQVGSCPNLQLLEILDTDLRKTVMQMSRGAICSNSGCTLSGIATASSTDDICTGTLRSCPNLGPLYTYWSADTVYDFCDAIAGCTSGIVGSTVSCVIDTDDDEIADTIDNCPGVANANQVDSDHNDLGDACDVTPTTTIYGLEDYRVKTAYFAFGDEPAPEPQSCDRDVECPPEKPFCEYHSQTCVECETDLNCDIPPNVACVENLCIDEKECMNLCELITLACLNLPDADSVICDKSNNLCLVSCGFEIDEDCTNGWDDNGDGHTDCEDKGCMDQEHCVAIAIFGSSENCYNGVDDNNNGLVDCADLGCTEDLICMIEAGKVITIPSTPFMVTPIERPFEYKGNSFDLLLNFRGAKVSIFTQDGVKVIPAYYPHYVSYDLNGDYNPNLYFLVTEEDPDLQWVDVTAYTRKESCRDGFDNDLDGMIDCADDDCNIICNTELVCDDYYDNDNDGMVDCNDPDCVKRSSALGFLCCQATTDCDEPEYYSCTNNLCQIRTTETGLCADGIDNDNDGMVDCNDPDCSTFDGPNDFTCCQNNADCVDGYCTSNVETADNGVFRNVCVSVYQVCDEENYRYQICGDDGYCAAGTCLPYTVEGDETCNNDIDDNNDGLEDCADPFCAADSSCVGPGPDSEIPCRNNNQCTASEFCYQNVCTPVPSEMKGLIKIVEKLPKKGEGRLQRLKLITKFLKEKIKKNK